VTPLIALLLAVVAAYGTHLLYTAFAFGWRGLRIAPKVVEHRPVAAVLRERLVQAGLQDVRLVEFVAVVLVLGAVGGGAALAVFGHGPAAAAIAVATASVPVTSARARRRARRELAREAWPQMLEELRLQVVSLGRSIPQALFDVGARGPAELRPAFEAARREWAIATDLERALDVLRSRLADPTADAVCETLLIAHEVGGTDVDRRLQALIDDRIQDLQGRKDARSKQAGVRFARTFVLLVPAGMALVGLLIGDGRAAYATAQGQAAVLVALALLAGCWWWASELLKLPEERRVFVSSKADP
jgi:tight adherence protein B